MTMKKDGTFFSRIDKPKIPNNASFKKIATKKKIGIFGVVFVFLITGIFLGTRYMKAKAANSTKTTLRTATVQKGEISTTITGSGAVSSSTEINVAPKVGSTITGVYVKAGDTVKTGDLLFELDNSDTKSNLESAQSNLEQGRLNSNNIVSNVESLNLKAPFSGQIKSLSVEASGTVNSNAAIATLVDTTKLKATLSFSDTKIRNVKIGSSVTIYCQDFMDTLTGKVTYVSATPYSTSSGGDVYSVDIEVTNPGALQSGMTVSAEIKTSQGTIESTDSAALKYVNQTIIKSSAGGTVTSLNARENEYVKKGDLIIKLKNDDTANSKLANDIKLKTLQKQVEDAQEKVDNCKVYATMDGKITKINVSNGDTVQAGNTAMILANYDSLQVQVDVDELDITSIQVGQEAKITADAIKDTETTPLTGKVSEIAVTGTSSNGVTTYPVTVLIDKSDKLKGGMNVNVEIYISKKSDILYVPIEGVIKRGKNNYVMIKSDAAVIAQMKKDGSYIDLFSGNNAGKDNASTSNSSSTNSSSSTKNSSARSSSTKSGGTGIFGGIGSSSTKSSSSKSATKTNSTLTKNKEYYANSYPVLVQLGVSNETNIEVTSGVNEGDIIVVPSTKAASSTSTTSSQQQGGDMGMPGGGGGGGGGGDMGGPPTN